MIVTLFALIAGGITIHYALESMTPGTALITIRSTDDKPITHIRILDATNADEEIYAGPPPDAPPGIQLVPDAEYLLTIIADGYKERSLAIELKPGETKTFDRTGFRTPPPSSSPTTPGAGYTKLTVETDPPGAMVYIDERPTQSKSTPLEERMSVRGASHSNYQAAIHRPRVQLYD